MSFVASHFSGGMFWESVKNKDNQIGKENQ
jgi:hypothetical protein